VDIDYGGGVMDLLEVYQKSVRVITFLKEHPGSGVAGHGVSLNEIARALRIKRSDIYPVIDYLLKEGYIARPDESNNGLFRLTNKALMLYR
jgi:DNA-binding MarR family transcriptional regulator